MKRYLLAATVVAVLTYQIVPSFVELAAAETCPSTRRSLAKVRAKIAGTKAKLEKAQDELAWFDQTELVEAAFYADEERKYQNGLAQEARGIAKELELVRDQETGGFAYWASSQDFSGLPTAVAVEVNAGACLIAAAATRNMFPKDLPPRKVYAEFERTDLVANKAMIDYLRERIGDERKRDPKDPKKILIDEKVVALQDELLREFNQYSTRIAAMLSQIESYALAKLQDDFNDAILRANYALNVRRFEMSVNTLTELRKQLRKVLKSPLC